MLNLIEIQIIQACCIVFEVSQGEDSDDILADENEEVCKLSQDSASDLLLVLPCHDENQDERVVLEANDNQLTGH